MRREINKLRWLRLLRNLDHRSRIHLRLFSGQVAFVILFSAPTLLIDQHRPILFLSLIHVMFGLSALVVLVAALVKRRPISPSSLCVWDHAFALLLLMLGCSAVLRLLA